MKISRLSTNAFASTESVSTLGSVSTLMTAGLSVDPESSCGSEFPCVAGSSVGTPSVAVTEKCVAGDENGKDVKRVSKKFYADLHDRVREVMMVMDSAHSAYTAVKMAIDNYIFKGIEPDKNALILVRMVFVLLKPEIDKAMMRSRKAKERAMARRLAKSSGDEISRLSEPDAAQEATGQKVAERKNAVMNDPDVDMTSGGVSNELKSSVDDVEDMRPLNRRDCRELQRLIRHAKKRALRAERDCA